MNDARRVRCGETGQDAPCRAKHFVRKKLPPEQIRGEPRDLDVVGHEVRAERRVGPMIVRAHDVTRAYFCKYPRLFGDPFAVLLRTLTGRHELYRHREPGAPIARPKHGRRASTPEGLGELVATRDDAVPDASDRQRPGLGNGKPIVLAHDAFTEGPEAAPTET